MKLNSKTISALIATSALAFGVAAQAEPAAKGCDGPGPMGGMPGMGMMREGMQTMGDPAARAERRLSQFKSQLKLDAQQEPLWMAFAEKMKAEAGQGMKKMREKAAEPLTAPERMAQMMGMMKERMAAMESTSETFKRLYDALTPEQKAIADKQGPFDGGMMAPPAKPRQAPLSPKSSAADHTHG